MRVESLGSNASNFESVFVRPFLPFSPFSGGCEEHLGNPENGGTKNLFPQICLSPHLFNPQWRHANMKLLRSSDKIPPKPRRTSQKDLHKIPLLSRIRRLFVTCGVFTRYFFVAFSWLFRGFFVALFCLEKQCLGLFRGFFVVFSWLFRGFFVAPVLGKIYAYSPWNSLLTGFPLFFVNLGPFFMNFLGVFSWRGLSGPKLKTVRKANSLRRKKR